LYFGFSCLESISKLIQQSISIYYKHLVLLFQVSWLGCYKSGVPHGQCWQWMEGGGYLTGEQLMSNNVQHVKHVEHTNAGPCPGIVDKDGEFTGDSIAFVYPDLETALVGQFCAGVMISARPARLESVEMVGAIMTPVFSIQTSQVVSFCMSTQYNLGDNPLVTDPYEGRTCQVHCHIITFVSS
jgi:hypothetical protein